MNRIVVAGWMLFLSFSANALEVAGIKVPEKRQSGEQVLVLNGAGVKHMAFVFPVYMIALYLPEKKHAVEEVLAESVNKRIDLTFMYSGATSGQLLDATYQLLKENLSAEDMKKLPTGWKMFSAIFEDVKDFSKGDQLSFDYVGTTGMRVSLNGKELGQVKELGFMRLFLMVWLGPNPAQVDVKSKLLGMAG